MNFIITLTGPSQSGKTLVMDKILHFGKEICGAGIYFAPKIVRKYTTRYLRLDELEQIERGKSLAVTSVKNIPHECDLVYQTYGVRYGLATEQLENMLLLSESPVVVINDVRAVEELQKLFPGKVLSLFLFRKIPRIEDFEEAAKNRGNVSAQEVTARYEKAVTIYRTYIENISLFDHVLLNAVEYSEKDLFAINTILDRQLRNMLVPILKGYKRLGRKRENQKGSKIFVIAGNAASGKDEIMRALLSMGKLEAKILPKYTMRQQEPEDGDEIICRFIPDEKWLKKMSNEYTEQREEIRQILAELNNMLKWGYRKEFFFFKQQMEMEEKNEYQRFWSMLDKKINFEPNDKIIKNYFMINKSYVDLTNIKKKGILIYEDSGVGVYNFENSMFLIYGNDNRLYGCDITNLENQIQNNDFHLVLAASQIGVVNVLKHLYGEEKVCLVYAHSEISEREFEANASDITKADKKKEFQEILESYTENISEFDHVTIYAKAKLTYEQTSKEEELIDQMFRLLRAY